MKYGLSENQLEEIISILQKYDEIEEAILFGSRVIGTYKKASDVDIVIKGKTSTLCFYQKFKIILKKKPTCRFSLILSIIIQ